MRAKSQTESNYSFLVAGHAYGAHAGTNIGLHPPLLKRLAEIKDTGLIGIFLTGDIVNTSTTASWNKVESELEALNLQSFYVMGNHDNNTLGHQIFKQKYGKDYYAFEYENELFMVLNSTESDRSISQAQLAFMDSVFIISNSRWDRVFIFFHEVIWNSHDKYKLVRSNSRSRYSQLKDISNFWTGVYPKLAALPEKKFFLFAGDVGGNPDAIAASYDCWGNVTLLSSGMGEVSDENYLKVNVLPDTVTFSLIPLNNGVEMHPITWYNIPEKPEKIDGPIMVSPLQSGVEYKALPVYNATGYRWNLSAGITGNSESSTIVLDFGEQFSGGDIWVMAINDGFGASELTALSVFAGGTAIAAVDKADISFEVIQYPGSLEFKCIYFPVQQVQIKLFDLTGKCVFNEFLMLTAGYGKKTIDINLIERGFLIAELSAGSHRMAKKIIVY